MGKGYVRICSRGNFSSKNDTIPCINRRDGRKLILEVADEYRLKVADMNDFTDVGSPHNLFYSYFGDDFPNKVTIKEGMQDDFLCLDKIFFLIPVGWQLN